MEHKDYLVDLIDEAGQVVGQKLRHQIRKKHDRYHSVHVMILTPQHEIVLSQIPERQDLPNVYARRLGTTVATIRRSGETAAQAAQRALQHDLFLREAALHRLGEAMFDLADGYRSLTTAFWVVAEPPERFSTIDIESLKVMPMPLFVAALRSNPDYFSATLREIWTRWGAKLGNQHG